MTTSCGGERPSIDLVGGILGTLLCLTGAIIWWPGLNHWRSSLSVRWKENRKGFNWALHSAMGFLVHRVHLHVGNHRDLPFDSGNPLMRSSIFLNPPMSRARRFGFGDQFLSGLLSGHFQFAGQPVQADLVCPGARARGLFVTDADVVKRVLGPWNEEKADCATQIDRR